MTIYLKQSTASQEVALGVFVDSTDGNTEETGLTIANTDIRLHKTGATTLANPSAGATHISNGIYYWVADATDTNTLGPMTVYCHPTGALAVRVECCVLAANVFDSLIGGGDILDVSTTQWLGTACSTPTVAGVPNVNVKTWNDLVTVALPLVPTTAGRTLDVSATGEAGLDWANVGSPATALDLSGTTIATTQKVDIETIKTNPVVNAGTVTFPTTATLASTTNIMAGTITTVTNLTNAPTSGDLTATMKTSVTTAATAATPIAASVTGAVGSVTGNVGGSVGSVVGAVGSVTGLTASNLDVAVSTLATAANLATVAGYLDTEISDIQARLPAALVSGRMDSSVGAVAANAITAAAIADGAIDRATFAADTGMVSIRSNTAQAGASTTITLDASASSVTDFYKNDLIVLTGGTGAGQGRYCTAYNGTTKVATVSAWATNPDVTSTFAIIAADAIVGATAPTASQVADEVQTRTIAAVTLVNGLAANVITAAATAADFTTEIQAGLATASAMSTVSTNVDAILVDTAEIGSAGAGLTALASAYNLAAVAGYLDTEIAAIKAVTDALPNAGALTSLATQASVNTIDDFLDTEIAAIKAKTDSLTFTAAGKIDANLLAIGGSTTALTAFKSAVQGNVIGTVGSGSTTTSIVTSSVTPATSVADQLKGRIVTFSDDTTTAALRGQSTDITASSASATPTLTVTALTTAPASSDTFTVT